MLSLHQMGTSLTQSNRMIAWADDAEDSVDDKETGERGPRLPMSEIRLSNFVFFYCNYIGLRNTHIRHSIPFTTGSIQSNNSSWYTLPYSRN